ncbi:hypothetical protein APC42_13245 [Acinetobacter pittii]|uniref:hypothetical protein n=1 Tax=Acinetobacter pittii TaxID=48296 RepID=UPI000708204F|nr:hypothetical protein [Acinetobacter pittii]KQE15655.1 hypothetical protein APD36_11570 [Acinetobacter pittii]KRI49792.1 hypothetical protein APC42_13245 [Acinetobacter pittii]
MSTNEREAFEEAYLSVGGKQRELELEDGEYTNSKSQLGWELWQIKTQAAPEGYVLIPLEPTEQQWGGLSRVLGRYMQSKDRYCPKTLKKHLDMFAHEIPDWLNKEVGNWESEHAFATADLPVFIYKAMINEYKSGVKQ